MARTQLTGSQVKDTSIGNADIQAGAVTNDKMADMLASRIKGRITSTGVPQDLTVAEVRAMLGIEAGATAGMTAAEILTAIKTVDGAESGLDADTVDGVQAASLVQTSRTISTTAPLTGGGALSGNLTLAISAATTSSAGSMSAADKAKLDGLSAPANIGTTINACPSVSIFDSNDNFVISDFSNSNLGAKVTLLQLKQLFLPVGSVMEYAGSSAPPGWVFCDGASYNRGIYSALFSVIGTTYGSVDSNSFSVPDKRGRVSIGLDNMGGTSANRVTNAAADTLGGSGGAETHTLVTDEMPSHSHNVLYRNTDGGSTLRATGFDTTSATNYLEYSVLTSTGGGGAHNNMQPWMACNFIIYTGAA